MSNKWHNRFMNMAVEAARWSKDPSTKVGAVIVDDQLRIVSTGFNGFAQGVKDTGARLADREQKYPLTLHAELNAILFAKRDLSNCTLYSTMPPCAACASAIIQAGIKRVVSLPPTADYLARWQGQFNLSCEVMEEAGVKQTLLVDRVAHDA